MLGLNNPRYAPEDLGRSRRSSTSLCTAAPISRPGQHSRVVLLPSSEYVKPVMSLHELEEQTE